MIQQSYLFYSMIFFSPFLSFSFPAPPPSPPPSKPPLATPFVLDHHTAFKTSTIPPQTGLVELLGSEMFGGIYGGHVFFLLCRADARLVGRERKCELSEENIEFVGDGAGLMGWLKLKIGSHVRSCIDFFNGCMGCFC